MKPNKKTDNKIYTESELLEMLNIMIKLISIELEEADLPEKQRIYDRGYLNALINIKEEIDVMM
jgi:hypothetical protein